MEENKNLVVNNKENFVEELKESHNVMFCTVNQDEPKAKALVFKAMNNPSNRVADYIGKVIKIKDIFVESVDIENEETHEIDTVPRIVLFDDNNETYEAVSRGLFNALQKLISVFGLPTYDEPIAVEIKQKAVKKGSMLTFDIV